MPAGGLPSCPSRCGARVFVDVKTVAQGLGLTEDELKARWKPAPYFLTFDPYKRTWGYVTENVPSAAAIHRPGHRTSQILVGQIRGHEPLRPRVKTRRSYPCRAARSAARRRSTIRTRERRGHRPAGQGWHGRDLGLLH